jgi:uncharacterized protein (TIGR02246 family)
MRCGVSRRFWLSINDISDFRFCSFGVEINTELFKIRKTKIMNKRLLTLSLLILEITVPNAAFSGLHDQDETDIRNVETRQQEAWNRHDAKAYADLFTEDADLVNVVGWRWKGRAEIEKKLTDAYVFVFRESVLTIKDVDVKFLAPEIAVAHVRWTMVGARTPKGIPEPQQGIQIQILQKQSGKWLITTFQNTNQLPEMPFPKGPPLSEPNSKVKP